MNLELLLKTGRDHNDKYLEIRERQPDLVASATGHVDVAMHAYSQVLRSDPDNYSALDGKMFSLRLLLEQETDTRARLKKSHRLSVTADKFMTVSPEHIDGFFAKGVAKRYMGEYQDAISFMNKAMSAIDQKSAFREFSLGMCLYQRAECNYELHKYEDVITDLNKLTSLSSAAVTKGDYINYCLFRGQVYEQMGRLDDARKDYYTAIDDLSDIVRFGHSKEIMSQYLHFTQRARRLTASKKYRVEIKEFARETIKEFKENISAKSGNAGG